MIYVGFAGAKVGACNITSQRTREKGKAVYVCLSSSLGDFPCAQQLLRWPRIREAYIAFEVLLWINDARESRVIVLSPTLAFVETPLEHRGKTRDELIW